MSAMQDVNFYIQDWNLSKLVSDKEIKEYVKSERGYEAREIVKGMIENGLLEENVKI
jgi:hypothetical protein